MADEKTQSHKCKAAAKKAGDLDEKRWTEPLNWVAKHKPATAK